MFSIVKVILVLVVLQHVLFKKVMMLSLKDTDGCVGRICYKDSTYPFEEIQSTWKNRPEEILDTFGNPTVTDINLRHDSKSRKTCKLCETTISFKAQLMSILDDNNLKSYVISTTKYPMPSIYLETCKSFESKCAVSDLPNDITTRCVQKMTTINLLTYNATSKEFVARAVNYPSACDCVLLIEDFDE